MRVAVERELACNAFGQSFECCLVGLAEVREDVLALSILVEVLVIVAVSSEKVVEFLDEAADGGDELDESFRNEHCTEVVALACAVSNGCCNLLYNLVECEILFLDFL